MTALYGEGTGKPGRTGGVKRPIEVVGTEPEVIVIVGRLADEVTGWKMTTALYGEGKDPGAPGGVNKPVEVTGMEPEPGRVTVGRLGVGTFTTTMAVTCPAETVGIVLVYGTLPLTWVIVASTTEELVGWKTTT